MEREEEFRKHLEELIKGIAGICPAYNSAVRTFKDIQGKPIDEVSSTYPEIFEPRIVPLLVSFFGLSTGVKVDIARYELGGRLLELIDKVEELLDKDEIRKLIGRALEISIPSPARDYVEACITTLREANPDTPKVLRSAAELGSYARLEGIIEKAREEGLDLTKEKLLEHLKGAHDLGILDRLDETYANVKEIYRRHVLELT